MKKDVATNVRFPQAVLRLLKIKAAEENKSLAQLIREAVAETYHISEAKLRRRKSLKQDPFFKIVGLCDSSTPDGARLGGKGVAAALPSDESSKLPRILQQTLVRMISDLGKEFERAQSVDELVDQTTEASVHFLVLMDVGAKLAQVPVDADKIQAEKLKEELIRLYFRKRGIDVNALGTAFDQPSISEMITAHLTTLRQAVEAREQSA